MAHAEITQMEESAEQMVYQSRHKLKDQYQDTWQVIAFKRITEDGAKDLKLRLSGFPGTANILHNHPLIIQTPEGDYFQAEDISEEAFTEGRDPQGNIGQYALSSVIDELPTKVELVLSLPTEDENEIKLAISPVYIQEWKELATKE
ncbi:DUF3122 domain-containing protein [Spirulina sp. CS-785/01]|uniref:DUF3122 domain-containing protein n=1 Tax=Spirulina sp. CS-785/01 TaxID=3021716 RepID=UPI00232B4D87|nr:DUF3122 domain-containing protein [Spirulina sp. CS-785/01]MDB9313786.1 DUF3122 domain-containing protein [Spirulina sp. CS-785/01]